MKYVIIGDLSKVKLEQLEVALSYERPDNLICTGNFGDVETIHKFMELEKRQRPTIKVPGKQDYDSYSRLKASEDDGTISNFDKELLGDNVAHEFIEKLIHPKEEKFVHYKRGLFLDEETFDRTHKTILIHGAYAGDSSSFPDFPKAMRRLYIRLITPRDYIENFKVMDDKKYNVMISGNNPTPVYAHTLPNGKIAFCNPEKDSEHTLFEKIKHVISPGALSSGNFATIDTRVSGKKFPILKFNKLP